ncbi:conserved hypothetical protein [Beutenbergia cavernae DSM 12333]|uniref:3-methyladenine DNA glycosylase n=1 Tax=Beutenbergia cavernae (strain ATCC BAA-8 / DSM 12333 / CCUG 43141 / JCM 11478 / NBRC 16432 / NCIMB 13614 / HKI 0122) TaxID=471853 RepID=C5C3B6_BEUC1|nr:3-methyladenine DNA glycosylase [Beutenbergia cavernae]ACQ79815.1 conserved hypothetical protein [Beutenbergia cavernae DSM 12333]
MTVPSTLPRPVWEEAARAHAAGAGERTAAHTARRARGETHPVDDFLFTYYPTKPGVLARWHPGVGTRLADAAGTPFADARWYRMDDDGAARLDVGAFVHERGRAVTHYAALLAATAERRPVTGCFGLHEWAMVYRERPGEHRHPLELRLGEDGTDAVVQEHGIRCTHYDAFRFFTPQARPRNAHQPTRATQLELEQPGCLHANMDLYRVATHLGPAVPGELLLATFDLAREIRQVDMRASPYDLEQWGYEPIRIETPEGKAEYVAHQRTFAARAQSLRARLLAVTTALEARADDRSETSAAAAAGR